MKLSFPCILSSVALAALLAWFIVWQPLSWPGTAEPCRIEVQAASGSEAQMTVRPDEGHGVQDWQPSDLIQTLPGDGAPHTVAVALPPQRMRAMKIEFTATPQVMIVGARLLFAGRPALDFLPQLQPGTATTVAHTPVGLLFRSAQGAASVKLEWHPGEPVSLSAGDDPSVGTVLAWTGLFTALLLGLQMLFTRLQSGPAWNRVSGSCVRVGGALRKAPAVTLAVVAIGAAAVSSFPVAFCNKSFVSPNNFPYLLYHGSPTVPGSPQEPAPSTKGSDVAATMVYCLPNSALEYDAFFHDHEFPFWNRYVSGGLPLFGQGQSMVGNPLHFLAIAADAAPWAWDMKFLVAKVLFCFGVGLCVWLMTQRLGISALIGASGAWLGFFAYRLNHPAFFSMSFAPWLLVPWLYAASTASRRTVLVAAFGLILADWCELTSGTAKEASMLLIFLNMAGFLVVLLNGENWTPRLRRLGVMIGASLCFLLLSAPHWLLFFDVMQHGVSWYENPEANQLSPGVLIGFFDDIFSQDFTTEEIHTHPSANFLVLAGVLWLVAGGVSKKRRGAFLALAWTAVPLAALVFGVVPPAWIKVTPVLKGIYHIFNTFGVPLILILQLLAGLGLSECLDRAGSPRWPAIFGRMAVGLAGILGLYLGYIQSVPPLPLPQLANTEPVLHSEFFLRYGAALLGAVLLLPWALRWIGQCGPHRLAGVFALAVCLFVLHFRHGMYVHTRYDGYVMTPRSRADLDADSNALEHVRGRLVEQPYRVAGYDLTLSPDYNALARLEGISNLDAFSNPYFMDIIKAAHFSTIGGPRIQLRQNALGPLKPVLDFLNLRYYVREPKVNPHPLKEVASLGVSDLEVAESHEAWPRAFFTDQVIQYADPADLIATIQQGDGQPFAATQAEKQPAQGAQKLPERKVVPAAHYRQTTNTTEFSVDVPGPGVIVLGEGYEEGNFLATLNDQPVPYLRVNHAFKGIRVSEAGHYRVRFEYRPHLLMAALWICAAGLVGTALGAFWLTQQSGEWLEPKVATLS